MTFVDAPSDTCPPTLSTGLIPPSRDGPTSAVPERSGHADYLLLTPRYYPLADLIDKCGASVHHLSGANRVRPQDATQWSLPWSLDLTDSCSMAQQDPASNDPIGGYYRDAPISPDLTR